MDVNNSVNERKIDGYARNDGRFPIYDVPVLLQLGLEDAFRGNTTYIDNIAIYAEYTVIPLHPNQT